MSLRQSAALFEAAAQRQSQPDEIRREIALRMDSPKRANPFRYISDQEDANRLPLFVSANEPTLL